MTAETLRELLRQQPFQPFALRMTNGDVFPIRHPEMAMVLKTKVIIGDPEADRSWICSLLHVASIETSQAA
jgi:hypothetical protein